MNYILRLDVAQILIGPVPSVDFGTSITNDITFVPLKVSSPGLLNEVAVPAITFLYFRNPPISDVFCESEILSFTPLIKL